MIHENLDLLLLKYSQHFHTLIFVTAQIGSYGRTKKIHMPKYISIHRSPYYSYLELNMKTILYIQLSITAFPRLHGKPQRATYNKATDRWGRQSLTPLVCHLLLYVPLSISRLSITCPPRHFISNHLSFSCVFFLLLCASCALLQCL